jgi:hypothetical protein
MRSIDPLMTTTVAADLGNFLPAPKPAQQTTVAADLGNFLPASTPLQQNNARVAQGQVQSQLWSSAAPAASLAWLGAPAGVSFATSTPAVNGNSTGSLPNSGSMPHYRQVGNACGTTTLAEIMSYLGVHMEQKDIDPSIRRMGGMFTAPDDMINFARDHGLSAEGYNNGSWDQVKNMIDMGCPVQAFVEGDSSVNVTDNGNPGKFSVDGMHYIAITGYGTDPTTGEQYVTYHDPNRDDGDQRMSVSDFQKMWDNTPFNYHDYFIAYGKNGTHLPAGNNDGIEAVQTGADGITNLTNGLNRIYSPDGVGSFLRAFPEISGGLSQTIGGGVGGGMQIAGNWINNEVNGVPVLKQFVQPFGDVLSGAGAVIGDIGNGVGKSYDDFGSAIESLTHGNFGDFASGIASSVADPVEGVVDSLGDAAKSVGHAVEDAFSWL